MELSTTTFFLDLLSVFSHCDSDGKSKSQCHVVENYSFIDS